MNQATNGGPLAGLTVIELAGIGPGPFAAMLLADMGADVIRIERPDGTASTMAPTLDVTRRGRQSVTINLRDPRGVAAVLDLVAKADVLIEGNRPGVTERIGLGPEDCWARNPRLVYGRMTGWGQDGPLAHSAGHDIGYLAITGALHAIGRPDEGPTIPVNLLGDFAGGSLYLVIGILAATIEAQRSGRGQVVDAAIVDGAASLTSMLHGLLAAEQWRDERGVNFLDGGVPWYDVYETADGEYMAAGPLEPKFYASFVELLGLTSEESDRSDPATWPQLAETFRATFATRTQAEWTDVFDGTDACVSPVVSLTAAAQHPHLTHRQTFVEIDGRTQPAPAPRFSRTPSTVRRGPVEPGTDTRAVLTSWGVTNVEELLASGVATQA
ncbi:CaiB/BaiF CoA transferase family protein [Aeromicrobium fastidiosum]|uniref:CoA transferase n=1 Tax=Aeromicrobium fastidiosum TaxID=52699 RepID=A0A641ASM9_9ACTN|nr:CaiB/BaiF CoA-transferase family protein [Aeromicrobium fastidiosum]KAA1379898.1 CoA transferase [Aeromicrobium fastidiosum]MBP2389404.1 alpha-methylacyl-CoA racemase [Aeromicrobium fastidiosum]